MANYYSEGAPKTLNTTAAYTVVFPVAPQVKLGDVNGDGSVTIADVAAMVDYLLGGDSTGFNVAAADIDGNQHVGMNDLASLIDMVLGASEGN